MYPDIYVCIQVNNGVLISDRIICMYILLQKNAIYLDLKIKKKIMNNYVLL